MSGSNSAIRLGIIGTGLAVEKLHWPALQRLRDQYTVVAFANHTRPKAEHFASYAGVSMNDYVQDYHDLLARDDVDAVLISLPIPLNYPVTRDVLEAGKDVICEKPAGKDMTEARAFVELVRSHPDRTVLIAENWFYRDDIRLAKSVLEAGAIGRLHLAAWRHVSQLIPRSGQFSSTPWRHEADYVGGPHLDAGIHHVAEIRALCGDVTRVYGETQDANETHGGPSDLTMTMAFASGAIGNYTASWPDIEVPPEDNDFRLYGTEGVMSLARGGFKVYRPGKKTQVYKPNMQDGGYYNEFLDFYQAVRHGDPLMGTVEQTWRNMQVVTAGLESATTGQVVQIDTWPDALRADALPLWTPRGNDPLFDNPESIRPITE